MRLASSRRSVWSPWPTTQRFQLSSYAAIQCTTVGYPLQLPMCSTAKPATCLHTTSRSGRRLSADGLFPQRVGRGSAVRKIYTQMCISDLAVYRMVIKGYCQSDTQSCSAFYCCCRQLAGELHGWTPVIEMLQMAFLGRKATAAWRLHAGRSTYTFYAQAQVSELLSINSIEHASEKPTSRRSSNRMPTYENSNRTQKCIWRLTWQIVCQVICARKCILQLTLWRK